MADFHRGVRAPMTAMPMAEPTAMCVRESKGAMLDQAARERV
jgi:hypothetical protein